MFLVFAAALMFVHANNDVVLCSINGKPVITASAFNKTLKEIIAGNTHFRGTPPAKLPKAIQWNFFHSLVVNVLMEAYADEKGIEQTPAFIQEYEKANKELKQALKIQFVEKEIKAKNQTVEKFVSDAKNRFAITINTAFFAN